MAPPAFLLLSGHNERAVVALCRYFTAAGIDFVLAASGPHDPVLRSKFADRVVLVRRDARLDVPVFDAAVRAAGRALVHCPTTEYLNHMVLDAREALAAVGYTSTLPSPAAYARVTSKRESIAVLRGAPGLAFPREMPLEAATPPCVVKPVVNVRGDRVLYPALCLDQDALDAARIGATAASHFAQEFVDGESHYLCAFVPPTGAPTWFWQRNLLQQPGGKSIVLAEACDEPGLAPLPLLERLRAAGHHGPVMVEVMRRGREWLYIETNPRFWGPLQLAVDHCPALLDAFARANGLPPRRAVARAGDGPARYAWAAGARIARANAPLRAFHGMTAREAEPLLAAYDVLSRGDWAA